MSIENHYLKFMEEAIKEARQSQDEEGLPIGSVLVMDSKVIGRGRNQRNQKKSVIFHAEMDAIENAGCISEDDYAKVELYTTLSPCQMCSGAIVYLGIRKVIMAENENVLGAEEFLKDNNIELVNLDLEECKKMFEDYLKDQLD